MSCKFPGCDRPTGQDEGNYNERRFCSAQHEVKYDHQKADARQAQWDAEAGV